MSSRWTGFFVWALVAASAAFWAIKVFAATRPVPPGAQAPQAVAANGPMERLFGAVAVQAVPAAPVHPESERFQLVGVIAPGYAVVALDGQPARSWHVGATLDGDTTLLAVSKRGAEFGPRGGPTAFSLQLPEPSAAETGTLAPATSQPDAAQLQGQGANAAHVAQPPSPVPPGQAQLPPANTPRHPGRPGNAQQPAQPQQPLEQNDGTTPAPPLQN